MPFISVPRVLIAGAYTGVGKSLLTMGLTVALRKRGMSVSCCVTGMDVHQAVLYQRMCRRYSRVLDPRFLSPDSIRFSLYQAALGADVVLIDGSRGLYDGSGDESLTGSDAEIARITGSPVILVSELAAFSNSAAALVAGYSNFAGGAPVGGIVINRHGSSEAGTELLAEKREKLNQHLARHSQPGCIGVVPQARLSDPLPPHGLSQEMNVTSFPAQFYNDLGDLVAQSIDIDAVMALSKNASEIELPLSTEPPQNRRCRIAFASDGCFSCSIPDNVDLLRYFGAEIVPFSPMADAELPERISGVYLGGAYLKSYGEDLWMNSGMRDSIRDFVDAGGLLFSEGAGTAYLCRRYQTSSEDDPFEGVGVLPFDAVLNTGAHSQIRMDLFDDSILGPAGEQLHGIDTSEFLAKGTDNAHGRGLTLVAEVREGAELLDIDPPPGRREGFSATAQSFSTFNFLHLGATPQAARALVEAAALVPLPHKGG